MHPSLRMFWLLVFGALLHAALATFSLLLYRTPPGSLHPWTPPGGALLVGLWFLWPLTLVGLTLRAHPRWLVPVLVAAALLVLALGTFYHAWLSRTFNNRPPRPQPLPTPLPTPNHGATANVPAARCLSLALVMPLRPSSHAC